MEGALVGFGVGGVISLPGLVVLAIVTGDASETVGTWWVVAAPLAAVGAALGALAGGRRAASSERARA